MKKLAFLTLPLLLAACTDSPQERADRARKAFDAHDYRAAQVDLAAALEANPQDPALLELHARNALAMGDGIAAEASLTKLPEGKRPADFALLVGEANLLRGMADEALTMLGTESSASAQRLRALAFLAKEDREGAAKAFAAGAAGKPDARLLSDYARFMLMGGDVKQARALADRAKAADPGMIDTLLADAEVATAEGRLAQALAGYEAAVDAYPGNLAALAGKAAVLGDLGRTADMEGVLKALAEVKGGGQVAYLQARAAAARSDWQTVRSVLQANEASLVGKDEATVLYAQALVQLKQPEQARAKLQPLLTRNPGSATLRRELAKAQLAADDPRGAVETMRPFAEVQTADAEDLRLLAKAAEASGDPDAAKLAEKAKFPSAQAMAATLAQADTAMKQSNWGNAIAAYERLLAVTDGKNPLVLNNMAYAQGMVGNKTKALEFAERAYKVAPASASVMDTLGWLLVETGKDRSRGLSLLRDAASKAPGNQTIAGHLRSAEKG
ncbi:MAG: tetratricopeptide repeat protein [Novosphingobium sp.]